MVEGAEILARRASEGRLREGKRDYLMMDMNVAAGLALVIALRLKAVLQPATEHDDYHLVQKLLGSISRAIPTMARRVKNTCLILGYSFKNTAAMGMTKMG